MLEREPVIFGQRPLQAAEQEIMRDMMETAGNVKDVEAKGTADNDYYGELADQDGENLLRKLEVQTSQHLMTQTLTWDMLRCV